MSVLKLKDELGNWVNVPSIKGADAKINGRNSITIEAGRNITIDETTSGIRINGEASGGGGNVDDVLVNGESVVQNKIANINLNGYVQDFDYVHTDNNFTTEEKEKLDSLENYDDTEIKEEITTIENKIPTQATSSNQLADKNFVNSSIATNTAYFRGTYESINELPTTGNTPNDYAFVIIYDETTGLVKQYDRYKWNTTWIYEYTLNNSSFTAYQWEAINSGITDNLVTKLDGIDLTDYVKNTDYASSSVGGVIKTTSTYASGLTSSGQLRSEAKTYTQYESLHDNAFIAKGTLENVIEGKKLVSDTNYITNSTDTSVTQQLEHNNEYRYTLDLTDITITLPETMPSDFISSIVFKSGGKSTSFNCPSQIKWSGNDINSNNFVPLSDKTYNIIIWNDGININGIVRGV